eukprot:scaffold1518_cov113-Skeletonema_menzelii.AAC.2
MPSPSKKIPSAAGKKRKQVVSKSANDGSGPPKKKHRYECSADGCTNRAINGKGGVCMRHGAKVKRCSSEGCTKYVVNGGVCFRHGAKTKRCSIDGCTNQAQNGGVCIRHGAKVKVYVYLCSKEGCTNHVINGGVCMRHGAKVKRCSSEGCTNIVVQGGVCMRHGAKVKRCNYEGCTKYALKGGVCMKHGAKLKRCNYEGCKKYAQKRGVCIRHGAKVTRKLCSVDGCKKHAHFVAAPNPQGNLLCRDVQGGCNQNNVLTVSDNEEEGEQKKISPIADRKRKAKVQEGEGGRTEAIVDGDNWGDDGHNESDFGGEDNGDEISEEGKQSQVVPEEITAIANGVDKEQELLILTSKLEDANIKVVNLIEQLSRTSAELGRISAELDAVKSRSKSEHEQLQSQLNNVEAEIKEKSVTIAQLEEQLEVEKATKLSWMAWWQAKLWGTEAQLETKVDAVAKLKAELDKVKAERDKMEVQRQSQLSESNNKVVALMKQLKEMSSELEDARSQSEAMAELETELAAEKEKKAEIDAQLMKVTKARLVEKVAKDAATAKLGEVTKEFEEAESFWNSRREVKKIFTMLNDTKSLLKAKSDDLLQLNREFGELTEQNESLQSQLDEQRAGENVDKVKEEELTDGEAMISRLKKRRTGRVAVGVDEAAVNLITGLEVTKREVELEEAREKIEELSAQIEELRGRKGFKVKWSSRVSSDTRDSLQNV